MGCACVLHVCVTSFTCRETAVVLSHDLSVTIDGVLIGNQICHTLTLVTTNNWQSDWVTHLKDYCNYSTYKVFSIFTSHCLVAPSSSGRSTSSEFPNCPRPQLPASHFSQLQLSTELLVLIVQPQHRPHRTAQKHVFYYCMFSHCWGNNVFTDLFPSNSCCTVTCLHSCYLAMGLHVTIWLQNVLNKHHSSPVKLCVVIVILINTAT
jgi:hypothetical protein